MTLATLLYSTSGSDTAASGAGPATAVTGTNAAHTGGVANQTVQFTDAPDLSGVSVSGDHVLWLNTTSGRHMSRITNKVAATSVTCEDFFNITLGGAVDYAIGGKRLTMNADSAREDLEDAKAGWRFEIEAGTHNWVNTLGVCPAAGDVTNGPIEIAGASGSKPIVTWTSDDPLIFASGGSHLDISNLDIRNTTSTNDAARVIRATASTLYLDMTDCILLCAGTCIFASGAMRGSVVGCDIESTRNAGLDLQVGLGVLIFDNEIHECGVARAGAGFGQGIILSNENARAHAQIISNIIRDCYENGIDADISQANAGRLIFSNVCHDNGLAGVLLSGTPIATQRNQVLNNLFTDNGGYGLNVAGATGGDLVVRNNYNGFRGNTSGEVNNVTKGANSVTCTADPYLDAASDIYLLNDVAGGGALLKFLGRGYDG